MWGFANNNCEMQLEHVVINETNRGPENRLNKHPDPLVWGSWVCGTGMGFYILWPHTAAFSKQSAIIRSDKRANSVHSGVKKKHVPLSLSSPFILHPYVTLFPLTFSHPPLVSPCYFTTFSVQAPAQWRADVHLTHALVTMDAFQLPGRRQIFVSMSSSLQSGSVWHNLGLFPRLAPKKVCCVILLFHNSHLISIKLCVCLRVNWKFIETLWSPMCLQNSSFSLFSVRNLPQICWKCWAFATDFQQPTLCAIGSSILC